MSSVLRSRLIHAVGYSLVADASLALTGAAPAASILFVGKNYPTDVSANGSVVVGNTAAAFETFRWTQGTGLVGLGRATVPVIHTGAGTPKVSADGTRVSGTIMDDANTFGTQGRWTLGSGWQALMPPPPADGGTSDGYYGSAFGISGDGNTVLGLYQRPGQTGGTVHASRWTQATGVQDLGSDGRQSRVEGANFDGSVIVGWDEHPSFGNRRAAVWENGVKTVFNPTGDGPTEAHAANPAGNIIVGDDFDFPNNSTNAAIWRKTGGSWVVQPLGVLAGTDQSFGGYSTANDVTSDGSIVVGFDQINFFDGSTGFVWTAATGMVSAVDYLTSIGIAVGPDFSVDNLTGVSDDGKTIIGYGTDLNTFQTKGFIVTVPEPISAGTLSLIGYIAVSRRRRGR